MARGALIKILRATRSALNTQRAGDALSAGEPYLITDEARLAVATAAGAYAETLMASDRQSSAYDTAANRLMATGAFGLGTTSPLGVTMTELNDYTALTNGVYTLGLGVASGGVQAGSYVVLINRFGANNVHQTLLPINGGDVGVAYERHLNFADTARAWTPRPYVIPAFLAQNSTIAAATSGTFLIGKDGSTPTVALNAGSNFSTSTGRFTAPIAGVYEFDASMTSGGEDTGAWWLNIRKNGSAVCHPALNYSKRYMTISQSARVALAVGDYVDAACSIQLGTSASLYNAVFSGNMVTG